MTSEANSNGGSPRIRVECYVRASALAESVYDTIERLEALAESGPVDDLALTAWPEAVALTDPMDSTEVLDTVDRFEAWADQWNFSIYPPFSVQSRGSEIADRDGEVLVTPMVTLAVYAEGALVGVFPHETDAETYRVTDAVDALADGDVLANGAPTTPADPPEEGACPVCAGPLVNGQGLYLCPECGRSVTATETGRYATSRSEPERTTLTPTR